MRFRTGPPGPAQPAYRSLLTASRAELRARGVVYLYPHVIPFDREGKLPPHDREQMRRFLEVARRVAPEMKVLPWVGGLRVGWRRTRVGTLDLSDLAQRQRIVAECRGLIDEGFHGVHLNIEPVDDGNDDLLALLRSLRTAVGDTNVLSLSAIKPGPMHLCSHPRSGRSTCRPKVAEWFTTLG